VIITVLGTAISLFLTVPLAYGLSIRSLPGRKLIMAFVLIIYLFSPGLIPVYLLITGMKLTNNYLAIISSARGQCLQHTGDDGLF